MFDYLQTCKQCLGQVAYFITVQCTVLQSDLTSSHPVPKSTSIHQHCNALRRPDHHCVITSLLAAGADDGVPAAALERLPGRHAGAAVQPPGEL